MAATDRGVAGIEEDGGGPGHGHQRARAAVRRAISGPLTPVTSGLSRSLADIPLRRSGHVTSPDRTDSQADSAGSIPVTRSKTKMQVRAVLLGQAQLPGNRSRSFVPLAGGCAGRAAVIVALAALGLDVKVDRLRDPLVSDNRPSI